jgi:hypothetical protein
MVTALHSSAHQHRSHDGGYAALMSTTTADVAAAAAATVSCSACKTSVPKPAAQWKPLWEAGWRWIGSWKLHSCPACPPVIVVDEQGRHRLGPGAQGRTGPLDG